MEWDKLASEESIERTEKALKANGIDVFVVGNSKDSVRKVLEIIPEGSQVMNMSSTTLDTIGLSKEIMESGRFASVKKKLASMGEDQKADKRMLGAGPEWSVGSVHAVTEDGKAIIASNTGSQLPAYAYGAEHVIWVVGTQKIVKNLDEGMKRLYEYILPLESERVRKVYGMPGSFPSKILILNREITSGRITMILVKEKLGF